MENNKKNKFKVFMVLFVLLVLIAGSSYAVWRYNYNGTSNNTISSTDLSFRFLESNKEIVSIDNAVPMSDEDGIKQEGTGNVFDFEVKSKVGATTDIKYVASLEKISVDSGKTALNDSDVKVYIEDFNGNTVLKPTKISELNSYKLFEKLHRHSRDNSEISTKYKLKVWIDSEVDVFSLENKQYKFKINVKTEQKEQDRNQSYKLVYDLDGGTGSISDSTFKVGDKVTITSVVPTKEGYNFLGWSTKKNASSASYKAGDSVTLNDAYDGSVRLYAVWESKGYKIKYDSNGGTGTISDTSYKLGESKKLTKNTFTKEGYTFIGWNTNKSSLSAIYTDEQVVSDLGQTGETVTLYAIWKANTYTVKYDSNGGTGSMANVTYSYGESKKLTKNTFTKDGYTFIGWNTNKDASTSLYTDEQEVSNLSKENDGVITLYAIWKVKKYDVSVVVQNGTVDVANKQVVEKQNGVFNLTPSDSNYKDTSVSCTNNQTGTFKDNVLTVSNVTSDTTCTVTYYKYSTVLYNDGTLILNEYSYNRESNTTKHGSVTKEYAPMDESNSYVFTLDENSGTVNTPWVSEAGSIKYVEIGSKMSPTSTAYWFYYTSKMEGGNFSNLDTSGVTNMDSMFGMAGYHSDTFILSGLDAWNTSSVINMRGVFGESGYKATSWSIGNLSNWNVSNVTTMRAMFGMAGSYSTVWDIGSLSNWDVSNVTDMFKMFSGMAASATTFNLDLSNWDTSSVTNMDSMFSDALFFSNTVFNLDLSKWNVSNVTDMDRMFDGAGKNATEWVVKIPKNTGSLNNSISKWSGSNESVYAEPASGRQFTLPADVNVVVQEGSLASGELSNKSGWTGDSFTFNIVPNDSSKTGFVSCTNNQTGTFKNNVLTVSNITSDTTCTVTYKSISTVLYNDGTLIMNELGVNRASNTSTHGTVTKEYPAMSDSNSYVFGNGSGVPWSDNKSSIIKVAIGDEMQPISTAYWFYELSNMQSGSFINLDTSNVTDMTAMFYNAGFSATSFNLNLSSWDVSKVTNMSSMFGASGFLSSTWSVGDLSSWDTSKVTNMYAIFNCAGRSSSTWNIGDLSSWDVSNVTNTSFMFNGAANKSPTWDIGNLSSWNVSKVTNMSYMFGSVGSAATNWNIGDISNWDVSNVIDMSSMFSNAGYNTTTWNIGDLSSWDVSNVTNMSFMFNGAANISPTWDIGNLSSWNVSKVTDMSSMFGSVGITATNWNIGDISNWDVSNVTNMSSMFSSAGFNATTWNIGNLSSWNVSKVTDMGSMFSNAGSHSTTWNVGDLSKWNVSNVTNMSSMFSNTGFNTTTWTIGDISNWDVSKVTNMSNMFASAGQNATTWNVGKLSDWDVSNVTDMSSMFNNSVKEGAMWANIGDLSKWNTSKVTNMSYMFANLGTGTFDGISDWDVSNVTDMSYMFSSSAGSVVDSLDLSKWNTSKVTNMSYMFSGYAHKDDVVILNLSGWDTSKVTNMTNMLSFGRVTSRTITIPKTSGSLTNTTSKWYGASEDVYVTGSFTLAT